MKAVFEEINGEMAVFIPDDLPKTYELPVTSLPESARMGDVFEVSVNEEDEIKLGERLPKEREKRERSAKRKREQLLKRSNK